MSDQPILETQVDPPEYLVMLHMALNSLKDMRENDQVEGRKSSIAITDLEKLIAYVTVYLVP